MILLLFHHHMVLLSVKKHNTKEENKKKVPTKSNAEKVKKKYIYMYTMLILFGAIRT